MHWDWELGMCQITNVADTNLDGCSTIFDLLSAYGNCGAKRCLGSAAIRLITKATNTRLCRLESSAGLLKT